MWKNSIVVFIVFFLVVFTDAEETGSVIAKVDGSAIYSNQVNLSVLGSETLQQKTDRLDGLINNIIIKNEIKRLKLNVTDEEANKRLDDLFKKNGIDEATANKMIAETKQTVLAMEEWYKDKSKEDEIYSKMLKGKISLETWKGWQKTYPTPEKLEQVKKQIPTGFADMKKRSLESLKKDMLHEKLMTLISKNVEDPNKATFLQQKWLLNKKKAATIQILNEELKKAWLLKLKKRQMLTFFKESKVKEEKAKAAENALLKKSPYFPAKVFLRDQKLLVTAVHFSADGILWVGTEENGVFAIHVKDPDAKILHWKYEDGLAENAVCSIASDLQGRIWVGHYRKGVSVFSEGKWERYGVDRGPLGTHVIDIAVCPKSGDVWLATDLGLTRYAPRLKQWDYFTRMDGLPEDAVSCVAVDSEGCVYAGFQSKGLVFSNVQDNKSWTLVSAPKGFGEHQFWEQPLTFKGKGLPSNRMNAFAVSPKGLVYAATQSGLAWQTALGVNDWSFLRGESYQQQIDGLFVPAQYERRRAEKFTAAYKKIPECKNKKYMMPTIYSWMEAPKYEKPNPEKDHLFPEDIIEDLAIDSNGVLYTTSRSGGGVFMVTPDGESLQMPRGELPDLAARIERARYKKMQKNPLTEKPFPKKQFWKGGNFNNVKTLTVNQNYLAAGFYPGGVAVWKRKTPLNETKIVESKKASFPKPAQVVSTETLKAWKEKIDALAERTETNKAWVAFLEEDTRTMGDWLGRYGRLWTLLCAIAAPRDQQITWVGNNSIANELKAYSGIGPNRMNRNDSARRWLHGLNFDNDRRVLFNPSAGVRRQSSWNDNGGAYPPYLAGPDLWAKLHVPKGLFRLTFYFRNKDSELLNNSRRDLSIRFFSGLEQLHEFYRHQPLLETRVSKFRNGIYKSFLIQGGQIYWVQIGARYGFNAELCSIMFDRLSDDYIDPTIKEQVPYLREGKSFFRYGNIHYTLPENASEKLKAADALWNTLETAWQKKGIEKWQRKMRLQAYRAALSEHVNQPQEQKTIDRLLYVWRFKLRLWTLSDRAEFDEVIDIARKDIKTRENIFNPDKRSEKFKARWSPSKKKYTSRLERLPREKTTKKE